jgi:hypothetical protein
MPTTQKDRRSSTREDARRETTELASNYGRIGISAVAAAARYCDGAKDVPPASEKPTWRKRAYEVA